MTTATADPDLLLLRRFSEGDEDAFTEIVRRYAGLVFSVCHRVLRDRASAEDVAQETFFRLLQSRRRVSQSLGGWLHRSATRLAVDALRSESARRRREAAFAADAARQTPDEASGSEASSWAEISPLVDQALAELADEPRDLLVRHFLQGVPQAEIAAASGASTATVSRRMKEAVGLLRERLAGKGVSIAPSVLLMLCARHGLEAAPATLLAQLGKMAMISGGAPSTAAASATPHWATFIRPLARPTRAVVQWPKTSMAAAAGLGLYLAIPYVWVLSASSPAPPKEPHVEHTVELAPAEPTTGDQSTINRGGEGR